MPKSEKLRYIHDCNRCVFLGRFKSSSHSTLLDIYWCNNSRKNSLSSILGRYGDSGEQYFSAHPPEAFADPFEFYDLCDYVRFALDRARKLGLYQGRFGVKDDRAQALLRLKSKYKISLFQDGFLKIGSSMKDYRKLFWIKSGETEASSIDYKQALVLIRKHYQR